MANLLTDILYGRVKPVKWYLCGNCKTYYRFDIYQIDANPVIHADKIREPDFCHRMDICPDCEVKIGLVQSGDFDM